MGSGEQAVGTIQSPRNAHAAGWLLLLLESGRGRLGAGAPARLAVPTRSTLGGLSPAAAAWLGPLLSGRKPSKARSQEGAKDAPHYLWAPQSPQHTGRDRLPPQSHSPPRFHL